MSAIPAYAKYTQYADMYLNLRAGGLTRAGAYASLLKMKYDRRLKTLELHVRTLKATGSALLEKKKVGGKPSLDESQKQKITEWVLEKNSKNEDFGLKHVQKFIFDTWGIHVVIQTCSNIMHELRFTQKTCQTKTPGHILTDKELGEQYMAFIAEMKDKHKFFTEPENIRSIDVTYTKRPTEKTQTWSPEGSGKMKSSKKVKLYTDAIVTMISADGMNHTPCILYTHNPKMAPTQKSTKRGREIRDAFDQDLKRFEITEDRIVYMQDKKNYCPETPDVYESFLKRYNVPCDMLILHDGGKAFKRKKVSIFDLLGYHNHVEYPSDVHQYMSPNDNKLHGCKARWSVEYAQLKDGVATSLRLMQLIDLDTTKNARKYFQNNLLSVKKSNLERVMRG